MFVFTLTYIKPINEVEKYLQQHIAYFKDYYHSGHFIASGRKVPRTGGVILCRAENKEQALAILQKDPFYIQQIAKYDIIEFVPSKHAKGFEAFI
ncbi:GTP cyclohydrolase [Gilliamella sp. Pra-s65]|uniref:YciI family protein n=1 Tax=unclassified Gilliamella TaxID=2685620 RepID=UPI001366440A|nr:MULTISPECIES: YciI family protein [unclassified Gilliamella]MWN90634.1 GTP cyclohydrolase [Gilliamella sp. Pra-s65]MWP73722.1 GTP cyclohydrolase [Gilliamella sp. Pra-s52]